MEMLSIGNKNKRTMKIGIITFHWATNFGAVLQTYALQQYLSSLNYDVEIINYKPKQYDLSVRSLLSKRLFSNILLWCKEQKIRKFRNHYLNLSKRYYSESELISNPPKCDIYITGSDQVWNPYFTQNGEGKVTLSYFLSFGSPNVKKIAYAVSYGVTEYNEKLRQIVAPVINNFERIGVRETSGLKILQSLSYKNIYQLVPDPTLLLNQHSYEKFIVENHREQSDCYVYILRDIQLCRKLNKDISKLGYRTLVSKFSDGSIEQWLTNIKCSKAVVTNSYHGMLFCIQFHVPFVVISENGHLSGMNDRFCTIMEELGIGNRTVISYDINDIINILRTKIDWQQVDIRLNEFKRKGYSFLENL